MAFENLGGSVDGPSIAIIGSPWLRDKEGRRLTEGDAAQHEAMAKAACEALGRELAVAGARLLVYSAEDHSIEPEVVKGYLTVRIDTHCIEFRHPRGSGGHFHGQDLPEEPIKDRGDAAGEWEVSFYRSLKDADGLLLLGGRSTVLIAGHVSLAFDRPIACVAHFDGAAAAVWRDLKLENGLSDEEYHLMGRPWTRDLAAPIVASLIRRCAARRQAIDARAAELAHYRDEDARRNEGRGALVATALAFALVVLLMMVGVTRSRTGAAVVIPFLIALVLGGAAGAGTRFVRIGATGNLWRTLVPGAIAGFLFAVVYLLPQLTNEQGLLSDATISLSVRLQLIIAPLFAIMGGMAWETVLSSFQKEAERRADHLPSLFVSSPPAKREDGNTRNTSPRRNDVHGQGTPADDAAARRD